LFGHQGARGPSCGPHSTHPEWTPTHLNYDDMMQTSIRKHLGSIENATRERQDWFWSEENSVLIEKLVLVAMLARAILIVFKSITI
jgi:hypothetical protein